jgi:Uma2 family endonuclease
MRYSRAMAEAARRPATWEDLVRLPEDTKAEILAGEMLFSPRPRPGHSRTQTTLGTSIGGPFDMGPSGPGGWWILTEPEIAFGPHDILAPDLAGWRRERVPVFFRERPIAVAPDWVCEILSPSTARLDRVRKPEVYLRAGVSFFWLVDVDNRTLEAFEAREGRWLRIGGWSDGDTPRVPPFEAIELDVTRVLPPSPPSAAEE